MYTEFNSYIFDIRINELQCEYGNECHSLEIPTIQDASRDTLRVITILKK